ncbi:GNAT family N-acetyltransferase [Kineococcus rubinsiae]|uniref:GNAT family N-acetyltransferase n=1 Tax=Kineococcus rubinsiae TaxID=2609562 RepID=UPI001431F975|nr:GNAT family N-acetyltransferase [Kineococcus rubinsiae]NIZ91346.1 GNAT family N-acetyltransferase [Kineococcus rubinsiae]
MPETAGPPDPRDAPRADSSDAPADGSGVRLALREEELVVGARVVVRHRLPDGSASDALGELLVVEPAELVVATRRGPVAVRRADVLAAKAVPPPPRRRGAPHVAVGVDDLQRLMAEHWRPVERERLGDWWLRAAGGFTGRANSCLAVGAAGTGLDDAVARVGAWYAHRSLPPRFALVHPAGTLGEGTPLADELTARGWAVETPTVVMTAATDDLPGAREMPLPAGDWTVDAADAPDEDWLAAYHYRGRGPVPAVGRTVLVSADAQVFVRVRDAGRTVAIARGSLSPGWAGLTAVEVAPSHRRRGLGRRVLGEVADWARAAGATSTYLQVAEANAGARALYEGAGFTVHHGYHYRVTP